jgi:hypothetical protein
MSQDKRASWPLKVLVEGIDDLAVVAQLRDRHQLTDNFHIVDCKGWDKITDNLIAYINERPTVKAIGVIVDADEDLGSRWVSLKNILQKRNYNVPDNPDPNGILIPGVGIYPTIGIWIMPDNTQSGKLENFVWNLIPQDNPLKPFAERILTEIDSASIENKYSRTDRDKALIHTWLAWQREPGKPMGLAIKATFLTHDTPLAQRFIGWLNALFNS